MIPVPFNASEHPRAPITTTPKGHYHVSRPGVTGGGFVSRYDAIRTSACIGAAMDWLDTMTAPGAGWEGMTLTDSQRSVIVAMFVSHKAILPDAAGTYRGMPAVSMGRDFRALDAKGFDVLHMDNRKHVRMCWWSA